MRRFGLPLAVLLAGALLESQTLAATPLDSASQKTFDTAVRPFLQAHCTKCHGEKETLAGLRVDTLETDFLAGKSADVWKEIYDRIGNGTMPPKDEPRPHATAAAAVTDWIVAELRLAEKRAKGSSGRVPTRRMNRTEYANTLRDLFYLDEQTVRALEQDLPSDGKVEGFDRGGAGLFIDQAQMARYLETADAILDREVFAAKPKLTSIRSVAREKIGWHPNKYQGRYTDLPVWPNGHPQRNNDNERVTLPIGANWATFKNGGLEFMGHGYHGDGGIDFHGGTWHSWGGPWHQPFVDGQYRLKVRAGAFKGTGKNAVDEARLWFQYCANTNLESKTNILIDAPIEAPKEFEAMVYLRYGSADQRKSLRIGWNGGSNGLEKLIIQSPEWTQLEKEAHHVYFSTEAILKKKPPASPEELAAAKKRVDEFALKHRQVMLDEVKVAYVFNPEIDLQTIPRLWIEWLELEGPLAPWPPKARTELFFDGEERTIDQAYITQIFTRFLPRAWRRPVDAKEVEEVVAWTLDAQRANNLSGVDAVREGVKMVLCSPSFLMLQEPAGEQPRPLTDFELACRMSYFLWSTMPDAQLVELAAQNKLHEPTVLREQVRRMIADPKSEGLVQNFTGQWLKVRDFATVVTDRHQYKAYDNELRDASYREPAEFFKEVLRENLSILNFVDSDFLVINDRLATHYGIAGVKGEAFRKVAITPEHRRGGVLGMAGVLTFGADGLRTLPVRRAAYVLDTLWNSPPPPPPPNVGDLPPVGKVKTVRERLELHRKSDSCASCHAKIDPFGMALENYDAIGAWRDRQNGERFNNDKNAPVLDTSGVLPSGREFKDVQQFKQALLAEKERFVHGFIEKMLTYALGRPVGATDRPTLEEITKSMEAAAPSGASEADKYRLQALVQAIVASQVFQTK